MHLDPALADIGGPCVKRDIRHGHLRQASEVVPRSLSAHGRASGNQSASTSAPDLRTLTPLRYRRLARRSRGGSNNSASQLNTAMRNPPSTAAPKLSTER
jgi:hypothetical protein